MNILTVRFDEILVYHLRYLGTFSTCLYVFIIIILNDDYMALKVVRLLLRGWRR